MNYSNQKIVKHSFIIIIFILGLSPASSYSQTSEVNSSGRTSYFWLTLKSQAGTTSGVDTDLILTNGYRSVNLSSADLSCTRKKNGASYIYHIKWTGNNLMGGKEAETLAFNIVVDAFENTNYTYTKNNCAITSLGKNTSLSDENNRWGISNKYNINAGKSIRMRQQDFTINNTDLFDTGLLLEAKFTNITVAKNSSRFSHKIILGVGENFKAANFRETKKSFNLSDESFSITGAGSNTKSKGGFAIEQIKFKLIIRNLALTKEDTEHPFSDVEDGHTYDEEAVEMMMNLPELEKKVRPWSWETPKRWAEIRKRRIPFTKKEIDIVCKASDIGGHATFRKYYPDIMYSAGYMNLEKDTDNPGLKGHYLEAPEHYLYKADKKVLAGGPKGGESAYFNLANPETRKWWLSDVAKELKGKENDGCSFFIDALAKVGAVASGDYYDYLGNPVSNKSYWEHTKKLMNVVREDYGDKFFLTGNFARPGTGNIRTRFSMNYTHVAYIESFEHFGNYIPHANEGIRLMQKLSRAGKWIQITVATRKPIPSDSLSLDEMRTKAQKAMPEIWAKYNENERKELSKLYAYFPVKLAMFLIGAGERSYFKYTDSKVVRTAGRDLFKNIMPFPEWNMPLGAPLAEGVNNSNIWWRRFEYVDVVFNLNKGTSRFIHKSKGNGNNLSRKGIASQSSDGIRGKASLAIDGNSNGSVSYGSLSRTKKETNPWWQVDLGKDHIINEMNILGRIDEGYPNGISNYTVYVKNSKGDITFSKTFKETIPSATVDAGGVLGKTVSIKLNGAGVLSLAEVEVFGR